MKKVRQWRQSLRPSAPRDPAPLAPESNNTVNTTLHSKDAPVFPDGIKILQNCTDAAVDICFVHGLTGNRDNTWTADGEGDSTPWPKKLLSPKLPQARVLTYGYDASVASKKVASQNRLIDHATNLLSDLTNDRECANASSRPLVFVAHSLGGLVCKKAVLLSRNTAEPHLRGIFDCLKGIVFMGTPHKGSWMADWSTIPASAFGLVKSTNFMLLDILQQDNQLLESIQVDFLAMIRGLRESGRRIEVTCFFEELPLPVVGKVVSKDSATLEGYTPLSIHANHSNMVKFASAEDNGFKRLLGELTRWNTQLGQLDQYNLTAEDRACLYDLQTTDPRDDKARIENTKGGLLRDSYRWVLENQEFQEWKSPEKPGELLWIKGDPGKGKTMLICGIIDELMAHNQGSISYFFCQATDTRLNTSTAVLRGLIYLLIVKQPSLISHVRARYDHSRKRLFEGINAWDALSKIFTAILKDAKSIYLVIDALDECVIGQPQLLDFLTQNSMAYPHVKWIVSGRNLPHIEESFNTIPQKTRLWLEINEKSVSQAVNIFIHHKVERLTDLKKYNQETRNAVMSHLLDNARGTFLWVALVCQKLAETPRLSTFQRLKAFPPGLDAIYQQMLNQVNERDESTLCKQVLAVASIVYRPITLHELTTFIDVDIPSDLAVNDLDSLADIIGYCGSFLTISNHTVFFVHQSAKDFLLKKASVEILPDGLAGAHHSVFSQSFQALEKTLRPDIYTLEAPGVSVNEARAKRPHPDPLAKIQYSCVYWIDHLICHFFDREINTDVRDCEIISVFLTQKYLYWLEALSLLNSIPQGLVAMTKLESVLLGYPRMSSLIDRVADASRFLRYHKRVIESSPLQLYSSCLIFSPIDSPTRSSFRTHLPDWVTMKPAINRWDPCLQTLEDHSDVITSVSRSFHESHLVSSSWDGTIRFWDLVAGQCILTLEGHTEGVKSIAWSHGNPELASASADNTIKIWNSATGCCLDTFYGHEDHVESVHWSHDGKMLISKSLDYSVKVWDRVSGNCIFTLLPNYERFSPVLFLKDKMQLITTLKSGSMVLWDLNTGSNVATLQGHCRRVNTLVSYHNETRLVSAAENINIWDLCTGRELATLDSHSERVNCLSLSPNGMRLASGSEDNTINIWDLSTYKYTGVLRGHTRTIQVLLWLSDDHLASASWDNSIKIWDVDSGQPISTFKCYGVSTLTISHGGRRLISGSTDSTIKVWDLKNLTGEHSREFSSVHWSRDGRWLASIARSVIKIWNPLTGESISSLEGHRGTIYSVAWSRDHRLAVATADHKVRVWDVFSATCIWILDTDIAVISTLFWSEDEDETRLTVNPNQDGVGMILDSTSGQCVSTFQGNIICPPSSWSPDGTLFAAVLANTIAICNTLTGEHVSTLQGHRGESENDHLSDNNTVIVITKDGNPNDDDRPSSICWARDGTRLASASGQSIKIWNVETGQCMLTLKTGRNAGELRFYGDFEEPNNNWLHTQMGWFDIGSYLALPANRLVLSSKPIGMGLSNDETWIKHGDKNILWLPPEFRPSPGLREGVLFQPLAVSGTTMALGCASGQVQFLDFSKEIACS